MKRTKRIAATVLGLTIAAAGALLAGGSPAWALATCPTDHVCFYQDFHDNNGSLSFAGSMSDQNNALINKPTEVVAAWENNAVINTDGKISDFRNSHFFNGQSINDSVSSIANNSNHCLFMFGNIFFDIPAGHAQEGVEMGPHSALALVGATFGNANDKLSSAYTIAPGEPGCDVADGGFKLLDQGGGGE